MGYTPKQALEDSIKAKAAREAEDEALVQEVLTWALARLEAYFKDPETNPSEPFTLSVRGTMGRHTRCIHVDRAAQALREIGWKVKHHPPGGSKGMPGVLNFDGIERPSSDGLAQG